MKYAKEQLHAMSDFEINKALCSLLGKDVSGICELRNHMTGAVTDFCNNPSDIMPLAFENKLRITPYVKSMWLCLSNHKDVRKRKEYFDKNPLRAIACCLILALQGEKE